MSKEYEVLHALRRNGADYKRGSTVELEELEASPLLRGGVLRQLPERQASASKPKGRPRKQESEDFNEE